MSEFDKVDVCVNCKIRDFCAQYPDDQYTCEDVMVMAGVLKPEPPKEGNDPLYDFSGWTTEMIVAKIREIERKKEIAYKEYIDLVASFNSQLRALYNLLSNENHFNCDEAPKEEGTC